MKFASSSSDMTSKITTQPSSSSAALLHNPEMLKAALLSVGLMGSTLLMGCQPTTSPTDKEAVEVNSNAEETVKPKADLKNAPGADALAQINKYEPLYVRQMLNLQQRLQAEYESLQVADATADVATEADNTMADADGVNRTNERNNESETQAANTASAPDAAANAQGEETLESLSTEVGERDLKVLKKISLEPQPPEILDENQLKARYRDALQALYAEPKLSAEAVETLINITTLLPVMFEEPELARQLSGKSPALARLIVQQQIWQQIEAQQVKDMQQMKIEQQAEFETLMSKFNETIQGYDEQIAKYEEMLKEFERK